MQRDAQPTARASRTAAALAAIWLSAAAFDASAQSAATFTLSCPMGTPVGTVVTQNFYTGTAGHWQYLSSAGGPWTNALIEPRDTTNTTHYYSGWFNTASLGGDWISPEHGAVTPVNQPYFFRSPVFKAAANIDPASMTITGLKVGADNYFKGYSIGNADRSAMDIDVAGPAPGSSWASNPAPTSITLSAAFTGQLVDGKHLFLHVANNEGHHRPLNSGTGGPLGTWAEIEVTGTCKAPPAPMPVPANAPWALGLLGAALGWLGTRAARKRRG